MEADVDGLRGPEVEHRDVEDGQSEVAGCGWFAREAARCRRQVASAIQGEFRAERDGCWAGGQAEVTGWALVGSGSGRWAQGDRTCCWSRQLESSVLAEVR